jgi:hypothetical protein
VAATKRGYLAGAYGATRPGRQGTPLLLASGQTVNVSIALARGAVVTGTIRDERGEPLAGLRVFAVNALKPVAPGPTDRDTGTLTDDRGVYRIHSLAPGEYLVVATPTVSVSADITRRSASETDAVLARLKDRASATVGARAAAASATRASSDLATLASVFHPGTASMAQATRIKLAPGDVRGLDFAMPIVPVTTIEGSIVSPDGTPPGSIDMSIIPEDTLRFFALAGTNPQLVKAPGADGQFKYSSITPGPYMIRARANRAPAPAAAGRGGALGFVPPGRGASTGDPETMYALEAFEVTGAPVTGLAVRLQRGSQFSGRLVFDGASQSAPSNLASVRVTVNPAGSTGSGSTVRGTVIGSTLTQARYADLRADGTFFVAGLAPGRYSVQVTVPPAAGQTAPGWLLRSAIVAGQDVLDTALDVALGTDVADVVVTMTDRRTELSGSLQTTAGLPAPEHFVIVFPADPALRVAGSRRVKSTRPATDGHYRFADLPAGDYLLAALTDVEPDEWEKPAFLAVIAPSGVRVGLGEGEQKVQDLRIVAQRGRVLAKPALHGQVTTSTLDSTPPSAEGAATVGRHRGEAGRNAGSGRKNSLQRQQTPRVRPRRRHRP